MHFFGDDIAWIYVNEADGRLYAFNPEFGVFGVAKDTNEGSNPNARLRLGEGSDALFTNVAYNPNTKEVWWEGRTKEPPADVTGWLRLARRADQRSPGGAPALQGGRRRVGAPQQPLHDHAGQRA